MNFSIAVDMDRSVPGQDTRQVARNALELVRRAEAGRVNNGFPEPADWALLANRDDYKPEMIRDSMMFGTPARVVERLRQYQAVGVDQFCYGASFGLPHALAVRSLGLFVAEVMPHFPSQPVPLLSSRA